MISFNNFLFTRKDRTISLDFARDTLANPDMVGILFVMTTNPTKSSTPFASTNRISYTGSEEDVLFLMHTVFRIHGIKFMDETQRLIQANLTKYFLYIITNV